MRVTLSLAGLTVAVRVEGAIDPAHVTARFGAYVTSDPADEGWSLAVVSDPGWEAPQPPVTAYPGVDVRRDGDAVVFTRYTDETRIDPAARAITVMARPSRVAREPVEDATVIDTPLRLWLAYVLPRLDGVLVHASGYGDARGAVIFPAVSGGGKTTAARKLPPDHVLSDDLVALRRTDGGWVAHALPFVGEYRRATRPRVAPLRAVALLEKSQRVALTRLRAVEALAGLVRCAVYFVPGDGGGARVLDQVASITAGVPAYRLQTTRDAPLDPLLDQLLR